MPKAANPKSRLEATVEDQLRAATRDRDRLENELTNVIHQLPRLRQMIEHSTDIMLLVDEACTIRDCNRSATVELGYPRDGLHGRDVRNLWVGDASGLVAGLEQAQPGQHTILTGDLSRQDETRIPIEAHIAAFDEGAHRYRVVVARNVSDRQQLELSLRHIQEQLAFVHERRAMEQELQKSNRLEALGTLAGGIAHDFNNILAVIRGNVEILSELPEDEREEAREDALEGLRQATNMAQQLLTFSKGGTVIRRPTDTAAWLSSCCRLAMSVSNHELILDLDDALPSVEIDEGQMTQVVHNLLKNAQEAMTKRGAITVTGRLGEDSGFDTPVLVISVRDQGPGIASDLAQRVFDPFFTTKEEGTGIGLATSHKIVREHEGVLRTAATEGAGATFEIVLPVAAASTSSTFTSRPSADQIPDLTGLCVLLMDDEQNVRSVIARTLRFAGAQVEECERGEDATKLYQSRLEQGSPYDAAVLDLVIRKGMGGIATIAKLRELDPGVLAIVCSGYSDEAVRDRFHSLGFHGYVSKPFSPSELVGAIADAVAEHASR